MITREDTLTPFLPALLQKVSLCFRAVMHTHHSMMQMYPTTSLLQGGGYKKVLSTLQAGGC